MRLPIPDTHSEVYQDDLNYLASLCSRSSESGYRFVYARRPGPNEKIATYRVRFKKPNDAAGRSVFEEYSAAWKTAAEAARFVVSLLKDRYGEHGWRTAIIGGRENSWSITCDPDEPWKYWLNIVLAGRKLPLDNHETDDGSFSSAAHAKWYLRTWAESRFPVSGLSALGYTPLPADDRGRGWDYTAGMVVPECWRVRQANIIDAYCGEWFRAELIVNPGMADNAH